MGAVARKLQAEAEEISYEDFLRYADEDEPAEWVAGKVLIRSPASRRHQRISLLLAQLMSIHVEKNALGEVLEAPFQMKTAYSGREPDILFVATAHLGRLGNTYLNGPADLVVEIASPESRLRDRGEKFAEYEMAGVREYWLIDPDLQRADFYQLDQSGRFATIAPDSGGLYHSRELSGFWIEVGWLWAEPLPAVLPTLERLGLLP